mgnify:FL=1
MIQEPLTISRAEKADCDEIYTLYHSLIDDPYGTWNDEYPSKECVENDLAENIVYVMRDATGRIVSSIVDEQDIHEFDNLAPWYEDVTRWAQLGRLGVAHGVANGILLAPVMEYNKDYTGEKYRDIADAFGIADAYTGDIETVREEAVQAVHKLTVDLKNPTKISEVGATEADLEPLAHDAFHDVCTPGNPRQATQEDILAIYKSLM